MIMNRFIKRSIGNAILHRHIFGETWSHIAQNKCHLKLICVRARSAWIITQSFGRFSITCLLWLWSKQQISIATLDLVHEIHDHADYHRQPTTKNNDPRSVWTMRKFTLPLKMIKHFEILILIIMLSCVIACLDCERTSDWNWL